MMKIEGKAIIYSLIILIIISIISVSFINILNNYYKINERFKFEENISNAMKLGEELVLVIQNEETIRLKNGINLKVVKSEWGAFLKAKIEVEYKTSKKVKKLLIGNSNKKKVVLNVVDGNRPITYSGNNNLIGDVKIPRKGFVKNDSREDSNAKLKIDGITTKSESIFSKLRVNWSSNKNEIKDIRNMSENVVNSFDNETILIQSDDDIELDNITLKGNIIVDIEGTIRINGNCKFEDIVIYANKIEIEKGFKGQLQIYALDEIIIEDSVKLEYPSMIGTISENETRVSIGKGCEITSHIFIVNNNDDKNNFLQIEEGTVIEGVINVEGSLDLKGSILGRVECKKLISKTNTGYRENYIKDLNIDLKSKSRYILSPIIDLKESNQSILKWCK